QKTKEHNDYSVFQCWGLGVDGNIYLIDQIRGKWEAWELEMKAAAFYAKHKPFDPKHPCPIRYIAIEDKASGTGLIQNIKKKSGAPVKPNFFLMFWIRPEPEALSSIAMNRIGHQASGTGLIQNRI